MTSVNNNDNNQKIYQFLQTQGGISEADTNGDGAVTKSEFRKFLEEGGFDFSALDGWNGEKATKSENDIINNFWKTINTNTSSAKIKGTKVRNSAALDEKEIKTIETRIKASEQLEQFVAELEIPSFVSDQDACRKEIQEKLMALVEKSFIKAVKNIEDLAEFLEEKTPQIKNQVSAEIYASECIAQNMGDLAKEYNYKYGDDATLKNMIGNLIKNMGPETDEAQIQEAIQNLVEGYLATAGIGGGEIPLNRAAAAKEDGEVDPVSAEAVWYSPTNNSQLNDLQKSVLETTLKKTFESVLKEYGADYEAYKDLYDKAVEDFIADTLKNTKFGDFENAKAYGKAEFEASEAGKKCLKTVQIKNISTGAKLDAAITAELTDSLAEYIRTNRRYLKAMTEIENKIVEKALAGDYGDPIDEDKVVQDLLNEIKANIASFYENGLGDMNVENLNKTYDVMRESAVAEPNAEKSLQGQRDAAVKYCETLSKKNNSFKEAVATVFGDDFKAAISKMMPSEIDAKIAELKEKINKLGDASTFKLDASSWNNLNRHDVYDLEEVRKSAQEYIATNNIQAKLQAAKSNYESDSYLRSLYNYYLTTANANINTINNSNNVQDVINAMNALNSSPLLNGTGIPEWTPPKSASEANAVQLPVGGSTTFNITPTITDAEGRPLELTSDRISYSEKSDLIEIAADGTVTIKAGNKKGNYEATIQILVDGVVVGEKTIKVTVFETIDLAKSNVSFEGKTLAEHLSAGNTALKLSGFADWGDAKNNAKGSISNYINKLVTLLKEQGFDVARLQNAAQSTINYYNAVIDTIYDNCYGSGSNRNTNIDVSYIDADGNLKHETTWYNQNTHKREARAGRTAEGAENIDHSSCGIRMNESYAGTNTYEYYINTAVLLKKFQSFFNAV